MEDADAQSPEPDPDGSEAGRSLARARWSPAQRVRTAANTLLKRADLTDGTRGELEQIVDELEGMD
jgi:hypothetical protein